MRSEKAGTETGWHTVAAGMLTAEPRRSLWEPRHEPMRARDYAGAFICAVVGIAAAYFFMAGTP